MSPKVCSVCGDKALGYNFSAITCESCKAFFRRNALLKKKLICPFNEKCDITLITRRFCQKCRLDKCFSVGMKTEHIMSEEDKKRKKRKIELNRVKRKQTKIKQSNGESNHDKTNDDCQSSDDSKSYQTFSLDSQEATSIVDESINGDIEMSFTTSYIVDSIINYPDKSSKSINDFMRTPHETITVLENIFNSHKDAMKFIDHLIKYPGDALKILSKLMNSPLNALQIFTKFMSSPELSLQIISKVANSPNDVLKFVQQLMRSPENAIDIMNKFMNTPEEALRIINDMVTSSESDSQQVMQPKNELDEENPENFNNNSETIDNNNEENVCDNEFTRSIDTIISDAIKLEYEINIPICQSASNKELNDIEAIKLNELKSASEALFHPVDDDIDYLNSNRIKNEYDEEQDPQLLNVINLTAVAIRRLIKMAKKITAFKNLCQEDQIALLKGGCTEMMIVRSVMSYTSANDQPTWKIPHSNEQQSNIRVDVLKLAKGNIYEEHNKFIQTFEPEWRKDENIILLMCAIVLFTPNRARIIHSDVIKFEQNSYYYLLRRYLESIYQGCEAKSTFLKLIQKISEVEKLNTSVIGVYLNVNPKQIEPLLREIFDLKIPNFV